MSKVTTKLQVTVPKAVAERYGIEPGDEIEWEPAEDYISVVPASRRRAPRPDVRERLRLFDATTARLKALQKVSPLRPARDRGWTRESLYDRGRAR